MTQKRAFLIFAFAATTAQANLSFEGLPPATSVQQARSQHIEVYNRLVQHGLEREIPSQTMAPNGDFQGFATSIIPRLLKKQDLANVSAKIMDPRFHPWLPGTSIKVLFCERVGDYDFLLQSLIRIAYLDDEAGKTLLTTEARAKLRNELLSEQGIRHHIKFTLDHCPKFIKITDTENHILTTETARYLANQLRFDETRDAKYDNAKNGFDDWYVNHLSQFLRTDFSELNSKPYQGYALIGISNLFTYARSPRVKLMAQMVLDYIAAKSALQSTGLRRRPPFRRQKEWRDHDDLRTYDNGMQFFMPDAGNYEFIKIESPEKLVWDGEDYTMFMAATDSYELPDAILDLFVAPTPQYQTIHHRDVEIYAPSKNFLISAGGRFRGQFGFFTGQNDEWGVSTMVIPAHSGLLHSKMFYLDGPSDWHKKNNLCVAPGFACGENFHAPVTSTSQVGHWSFYDTPDFYLAAYTENKYAMIEVRERTLSFGEFQAAVLKNTVSLKKGKLAQYRSSAGQTIAFYPEAGQLGLSPIVSLNGFRQERETAKWPFLKGTILHSSGDGLITIDNPKLRQRVILDDREIQNPQRRIEKY